MVSVGLLGLKRAAIILPVAYTGAWLGYYGESPVCLQRAPSLDQSSSLIWWTKDLSPHYPSDTAILQNRWEA